MSRPTEPAEVLLGCLDKLDGSRQAQPPDRGRLALSTDSPPTSTAPHKRRTMACMTIPSYESLKDVPVGSDADLTERLVATLGRALNRQVWLLFLDADDLQLPVLMPTEVPQLPSGEDAERIGGFLKSLGDDLDAETVVIAYERPGFATINEHDKVWLRCLREACLASGMKFRGPFLCHSRGVVRVAPDDFS